MTMILLLEDNADMRKVLHLMLEEMGYQVVSVRGVQEGIDFLAQVEYKPDLIISDLYMPPLNGTAILEFIRNSAEWFSIPFIMMSSFSSNDVQRTAFEFGADAFLIKPFHYATLTNTLRNLGVMIPVGV